MPLLPSQQSSTVTRDLEELINQHSNRRFNGRNSAQELLAKARGSPWNSPRAAKKTPTSCPPPTRRKTFQDCQPTTAITTDQNDIAPAPPPEMVLPKNAMFHMELEVPNTPRA